MEYQYRAGDKVRVLEAESLDWRSHFAGRLLTLKKHDPWDEPAWSVEEKDCEYRFRESELVLAGPVVTRTVTRQEIIPGTYDGVIVETHEPGVVLVGFAHPYDQHFTSMDHVALTRAAAVLTALAEALRDGE